MSAVCSVTCNKHCISKWITCHVAKGEMDCVPHSPRLSIQREAGLQQCAKYLHTYTCACWLCNSACSTSAAQLHAQPRNFSCPSYD